MTDRSIHDEADVRVPRLAWDEFVTALTTGIPFHVNDRAATRLAVAGDPSLAPEHTCRPGVIGSAYACAACWIARPGEPTDG